MSGTVRVSRAAEKELTRLSEITHARLAARIIALENDPRPCGVKKLSGCSEFRLRVGDDRILYIVDDGSREVTIVAVGHRGDVYR